MRAACVSGLQPSAVITATYVMKTYFTLPVMYRQPDPDEFRGTRRPACWRRARALTC